MESIQEAWQKIKVSFEIGVGEWGVIALILCIALSAFGLGRLSVFAEEKGRISIIKADSLPPAMALGGMYEASKSGGSYYFPWCSGAESIAPADQVWFKSEAAAQAAGYTPAKACKGMSAAHH